MTEELHTQRFYKHSSDKAEIGWKTCMDREVVGPNLKHAIGVLSEQCLQQRASRYVQEGGWSGDLYVIHRRLFQFQNEKSRFMGDSGTGGNQIANVYEVIMNSTDGWSQCLSLILKGDYDDNVAKKLAELDFAPKHSYLAKNDRVAEREKGLWLDDFVDISDLMPRAKSKQLV